MTIKRFGVQLAASGIVILLGALGVSQAQRESKPADTAQWDLENPPAMGPPPPIAMGVDDESFMARSGQRSDSPAYSALAMPSDPPQASGFGAAPMPGQSGGVRQVNHEESFALPPQTYVDQPTAETAPAGAASDGPSSSGFALPAWSMNDPAPENDSSAAPPAAMSMAGIAASDTQAPAAQAPPDASAMPTLQFGSGPSDPAMDANNSSGFAPVGDSPESSGPVNGLREFGSAETAPSGDFATPQPAAQEDFAASDGPSASFGDQPAYGPIGSVDQEPAGPASTFALPPIQVSAESQPPAVPFGGPSPRTQPNTEAYSASPPAAAYNAADMHPAAAPIARVASASSTLPAMIDPQTADEIVLNEPGDRRLDGMQSPSVVIHKRAPEQVKVGKPATFVIQVQNVGGVEALDVQVHDRVPAGMRLVDATPQPHMQGDLMLWQLGALEPGGERTISLQLVPEAEGELGSVARVTFEAAASVRTFSTRPALKITQRAPQQVLIGQQLEIELEVSNPGTGVATGVILQADVPDGFEHPKGRELDNLIGTLAPGETRRQVLRLRAVAPGTVQSQVRLVADDELTASDSVNVEVVAPQLAIELEGPARRFLERQATYQINIANVGSAEASNVEIVAYLDRGFSFVGTEYQGQYDASRHAVYWSLAELPVEARGAVPLTLLPIEQGERAIRLEARGDLNLIARHEKKVSVDALAELTFSITDDADPIEVGSTATYEIRLINRGSRDDADVKLKLQLPPGLELVSSESDASTDGRGLVVFAPQSVMAARTETVHRVRVKGTAPGTHVVKAIVASREAPVAVTKEESTTVYADE